ncbi:MAG TPA: MoxR family ATPase [Candidatus Dormibacteraeota bacterium]|jgi:MoxR-like ATPase|nr:MoxR family ATPase [Candidatus Dormibacteraeota bacterium]
MTAAQDFHQKFLTEARKCVVGQDEAIRLCALAVAVGGHVLLEGVPGTAKTLLAKTIARILELSYARIQFTPDLMPADIVGTAVYDLQAREFRVRRGPVFTNVLLADEINRAPAKVQSALLEAMEERGVSLEGEQVPLPDPFLVLATQNPVEYEGTYPLPEAQQDRFLFKVVLDYPTPESELEVLRRWNSGIELRDPVAAGVEQVLSPRSVAEVRAQIQGVIVDEQIQRYIIELAVASRTAGELALGASTRGEVLLLQAAKAAAAFDGRDFVTPDDVKALLSPTFRHRLIVRPEAEVAGQTANLVLESIIAQVTPPR